MSDELNHRADTPNDESGDRATNHQSDRTPEAGENESAYDVAGAALGALSPTEEADLYAAAATDSSVSADLAAMEAVVAELARLAPSASMNRGRSAGIRSRLVARAAATHAARPAARAPGSDAGAASARPVVRPAGRPASPPPHRATAPTGSGSGSPSARHVTGSHVVPFEPRTRGGLGRTLGIAALAAAVLVAAFGIYTWRRSGAKLGGSETAAVARDSALEAQIASLRASVAEKDALIATLTGMHTRVIDLVSYKSAAPMARMFWDQKQQMFFMYASNVKPPASGKIYQVWLIARNAPPVSAGTFMPDSSGAAAISAWHPMPPGSLSRIAVTEEPKGGAPIPTGQVVFAGVGR